MNGMWMACSARFMPGGWLFSGWTIFFSPSGGFASMFSLFGQLFFPVVTVLYLRLWSAAGALLVRACTRFRFNVAEVAVEHPRRLRSVRSGWRRARLRFPHRVVPGATVSALHHELR